MTDTNTSKNTGLFIWISQQIPIISQNNINCLVFITGKECVLCEVEGFCI